jgi:phage terminase large subunit-like protein
MRYPDHPSTEYAVKVLSGEIVACKWIKLACLRHLTDLEHGQKRGLEFSEVAADRVLDFFTILKHSKGEWAGNRFELELWQKFILSNVFGWLRSSDGMRRFRVVYEEIARKNGKSTKLAGLGNYLFIFDGEPGAEIYSAATKRDQAKIVHDEATRMVKLCPSLKKRVTVYKNNLHIQATASKFEPLGSDADSTDGLNIHGAIVDELHAHKTRAMWDVLVTAIGSRRQPLVYAITTAGFDQSGICFEQRTYATQILKGTIQDDTFFAAIFTLDRKADWPDLEIEDDFRDEKVWIKANPNLDVSVKRDDLRAAVSASASSPASVNNLLTKRFNVWTQQSTRWLSLDIWDQNNIRPVDEDVLEGRECIAGGDIASVSDLTCFAYLFPDLKDPDLIDVVLRTWCPESRLHDPKNKYADQYQAWKRLGFLLTTEGDAVDYDFIRAQIVQDAQKFKIRELAVDRLFQGYEFSTKLNEQIGGTEQNPVIFACGMGFLSMAGPCNELESLLLRRKLNHGGNPVLRFMADSAAVKVDPAGNKKPDKDKSQGKIDGLVAILLALDRKLRVPVVTVSRYEDTSAKVITF